MIKKQKLSLSTVQSYIKYKIRFWGDFCTNETDMTLFTTLGKHMAPGV